MFGFVLILEIASFSSSISSFLSLSLSLFLSFALCRFTSRAFPGSMNKAVNAFALSSMELIFSTRKIVFTDHPSLNVLRKGSTIKRGFAFAMNMKFDKQSSNQMAQSVGKNMNKEYVSIAL